MINVTKLSKALNRQIIKSDKIIHKHHPGAIKSLEKLGIKPGKIRENAAKLLTSGALTSALMLSSPAIQHVPALAASLKTSQLTNSQREQLFSNELKAVLPDNVSPLNSNQEATIQSLIKELWNIDASANLESEKLNQSYGYIGAEQHLPRFPGDTTSQHDAYQQSGITPGRGAWGYFANSKSELTPDLIDKEKYYVAVQTLYLPDWNRRLNYLRDWYKYRKVVVVNPVNGKTIICDIADSGPANFTGKHFGGSPEVMAYLGLNVGMQKGPVVLFFVDDAENQIPLGPLQYNGVKL